MLLLKISQDFLSYMKKLLKKSYKQMMLMQKSKNKINGLIRKDENINVKRIKNIDEMTD